ncbi:MAG: MlaD family protein [Pseudomonadota bacterium]
METKANYVLIGIFTLAGLLGSLLFLLWLAKLEVNRQFAYYEILFDSVSGLGNAGDVRYNGLPVGQIVELRLDPDDPSKVRVRIEVSADTPITTDTVASVAGQGVTGVSFVALRGGSAGADALPEGGLIPAEPSVLQSVLEGAPVLLQRAVTLLENINDVVNQQNRDAVTEVLGNLASASGRFDRALEDFEALSSDLGQAAQDVSDFTNRLDALADTADITLSTATETLSEGRVAIARGTTALETADKTLKSLDEAFASAQALVEGDITNFVQQGTTAAARIETALDALEGPAESALSQTTTTLSEAEQTFAAANRIFDQDIDAMIADIRGAVGVFSETMRNASANIDAISGEVLQASQSAAGFSQTLEAVVTRNERQLANFLRLGLPEFLQLTEEARQLVRNLDRFVDRVDRDPARYLFGTQGSEFRR